MSKILDDHQKALVRTDGSNLERLTRLPDLYPNTQWIGGFAIGQGTFGLATLWVLVDKITSRAVAHAVIKDAFERVWISTAEKDIYTGIYLQLKNKGLDFGADLTHPVNQAAPELRFLKEAYLQGLMTVPNVTEEIYAVPLHGYARKLLNPPHVPGYNHWRLYQPLYDYGDLQKLIAAHYYKAQAIPEPFLWHTLMCLMRAAVQLEEQAQLRPGEKTPSDVIVVFDMKPGNIFLAKPDRTSTFPIYPRPHIADLGGGCLTSDTDYPNESCEMEFAYSPGFLAPEMSPAARENYLRGTCTNVWQIGRVLEYMMKLELEDGRFDDIEYRPYPEKKAFQMEPQIVEYQYRLPAQNNYSVVLKQMVADCLRFDPRKRPSPQDVLTSMENLKYLFRGMDTFGNDEWFSTRQKNRDKLPKSHLSPTAEAEKQRRIAGARPYLRAWGSTRAAEYADLGLFPREQYEVLYYQEANWWATETAD
jgi:hypothetical protein